MECELARTKRLQMNGNNNNNEQRLNDPVFLSLTGEGHEFSFTSSEVACCISTGLNMINEQLGIKEKNTAG